MAVAAVPRERVHALVLSGGSGTRFWPLSRDLNPKQMLKVFGEESLVAQAIERARSLAGGGVHLLTNEALRDELRDHLASAPWRDEVDILAEPAPRNTAPAVALGAAYVRSLDPEAVMLVLPSDHLVEDGDEWEAVMREATHLAADGCLVTVGLAPTRAETGYGYIKTGAPVAAHEECEVTARRVERFVEKPDAATAEAYVAEGSYLWNSGMLVARAADVLDELARAGALAATPDSAEGATIAAAAETVASMPTAEWVSDAARESFSSLPPVPFDKVVLEVSDRVVVVPAAFAWSDVGSLLAVEALALPDERGNVLVGRTADVDSHDSLVYSTDRLVATLGLEGALVVDTADATLVTTKDRAQDVRLVVDALREAGAREVVAPRTAMRPWGHWTLLLRGEGFQIKSILVHPGSRLSLQTHARRSEHWVVVRGRARVTIGEQTMDVERNRSVHVPVGERHRLQNPGAEPLEVIEVAVGDYLEEDDIVRFDDDWGR